MKINHPIEHLDFNTIKEITEFKSILEKSVEKAFKEKSPIAEFWYNNHHYVISINSWDFTMGYIYGLEVFSKLLNEESETNKNKK
jgi:hypothetical protein